MDKCLVVGYLGRDKGYLGEVQDLEKGMKLVREEMGCKPMSLLNNKVRTSAPWVIQILADVFLLIRCRRVLLMPGWEKGRTARVLFNLAKWLGKDIWCVED